MPMYRESLKLNMHDACCNACSTHGYSEVLGSKLPVKPEVLVLTLINSWLMFKSDQKRELGYYVMAGLANLWVIKLVA